MSAGFAAAGPNLPGADISATRFIAQVAVGAVAGKLGGGSYENGAMSAAFGYLFNHLAADGRTGPVIDKLRDSSIGSDRISAIERSEKSVFVHFDDNFAAPAGDPGMTQLNANGSITITINPTTVGNWQFQATDGKWYPNTLERTLAHELAGHGYDLATSNLHAARQSTRQNYAITIENRVMNQLYPSSPYRVDTHGCCFRRSP